MIDIPVDKLRGRVIGRCLVKMGVLSRKNLCIVLRNQKEKNKILSWARFW